MKRRVLVIGAGVVGLCTALYCLRRGFAVTLVERDGPDRRGCSFGNAGMIVPSHFVPLAAPGAVRQGLAWMLDPRAPFRIKPRLSPDLFAWLLRFARSATREHVQRASPVLRDLCLASRACFEALATEPGADFGLVREGLLMVCRTPHAFAEETSTAEFACELGLPATIHAGSSAAEMEPGLRSDVAGAIHYPLDWHLSPDRLMAWLDAEVMRAGAQLRWNSEIVEWRRQGRNLLAARTREGTEIRADEFVLCCGSWSGALARELGVRIPMQPGKGYSLTLPTHANPPRHCAILCEARVAVTPMDAGVRVGGTMEIAGFDAPIDARRVRAIVDALPQYYTSLGPADFDGVASWSGLRPCTPDGLPCIGRPRRYANLVVAAGHAMMGVTLGPVTGSIVADLLAGFTPRFGMAALAPDRFA
jgi:D-amino-acid dehydrogenase